MKYKSQFIFLALIFLTISCSKEENVVNGGNNNYTLFGNWSTVGYQILRQNNLAYEIIVTFTETDIAMNINSYGYDDSTNSWTFNGAMTKSGTYTNKNNFIQIIDNHGAGKDDWHIWHYNLQENNLIINSAWDAGGIYSGSSDELTSGGWNRIVTDYNDSMGVFIAYTQKYFFNTDLTGRRESFNPSSGYTFITNFNYLVNNDELAFYYDGGGTYIAKYSIQSKELYLYGKPGTSTDDDYWQFQLSRL